MTWPSDATLTIVLDRVPQLLLALGTFVVAMRTMFKTAAVQKLVNGTATKAQGDIEALRAEQKQLYGELIEMAKQQLPTLPPLPERRRSPG